MFFWVTSPTASGQRVFDTPLFFDVTPPDSNDARQFMSHAAGTLRPASLRSGQAGPHGLPVIISKTGQLFEIERPTLGSGGKALVQEASGKHVEVHRVAISAGGTVKFFDAAGKAIAHPRPVRSEHARGTGFVHRFTSSSGKPIFLDVSGNVVDVEQGQATTDAVLQTQTKSLVYYAIQVNDVYAYFLTGTKTGAITPTPTQFPTTQSDVDKIGSFASSLGHTFTDAQALVITLKSAWVDASTLSNPGSYITIQATIPVYDMSNPNQWRLTGETSATLALVGLHIVGSTSGHPEMIWASFEHFGNTPNASYDYLGTGGPKTVPQSTSGTWLFSSSNSSGPFNVEHMRWNPPAINSANGMTISPSDTMRMAAWGGAVDKSPNPIDPTTADSNTEIIAINNSLQSQLPAGDVRGNYFLIGATWTPNGVPPSGFPFGVPGDTGPAVGTSIMANSTMETYAQGQTNQWSSGLGCFSCHNGTMLGSAGGGGLSHIFGELQPLPPPPPPPTCVDVGCRKGEFCCDCTAPPICEPDTTAGHNNCARLCNN
jgi:hypothetical protein